MTEKKRRPDADQRAKVLGELQDATTGEAAWTSFRTEIDAVADREDRLPSVDHFLMSTQGTWVLTHVIDPEIEAAVAHLTASDRNAVLKAWKRLRPLFHAQFFAANQLTIHGFPEAMRPRVKDLLEEGFTLAATGKHWLGVLETIGAVTSAVAAAIRAGRGHIDLAGDLQGLSPILRKNWAILEPLQKHVTDATTKLSLESIEKMGVLGSKLHDVLTGTGDTPSKDETDWRKQVIGLFTLLDHDYALVRAAVQFHLTVSGRAADAAALPTLRGLTLVGRSRAPATKTEAPEPAPEPTPVAEPVE